MAKFARGEPTKEFFVGMLTRDIELNDAILDLLDNCLDGVLRLKPKTDDSAFYKGYNAEILIASDSFIIQDNCGGIPRKIAEEKAFRMGRPAGNEENVPSVGIYGIGMKRAIFKMGRRAEVKTKNAGSSYMVEVPENWGLKSNWDFDITDNVDTPEYISDGGTYIRVSDLNEGIIELWKSPEHINTFVNCLIQRIQQSYSLIIEKGFFITVNSKTVTPNPTSLLASPSENGIKPYIYKNTYDNVSVKLAIGFYEPLPTDELIEEYNDAKRSTSEAGWTVVCNDRVVVYNDKTFITGWGEAGVPNYHTQFIGIKGIVLFESNEPEKLPMTTTKRGVDLSSPIYAAVKEEMRKGLKIFTNYTNQWKGRLQQEREYSAQTTSHPILQLIEDEELQKEIQLVPIKRKDEERYSPTLPKPQNDKDFVFVRYSKPRDEIAFLSKELFCDELSEVGASRVGERCFEIVMEQHKN